MLNQYVQCIIGYIRFGPYVDIKKKEWSKHVLLDKFVRIYSVFVGVFETYDFFFLIKSRTFLGRGWMIPLRVDTYCRIF